MNSNTETHVQRLLLSPTGTYEVPYRRPYNASVSTESINHIADATHGGSRLNIDSLQGVASEVLQPMADPESPASIERGWTERRFRMILTVTEKNPFGRNYVQRIFYGYTNHCNASYADSLDPNMRIYFNSETTIQVDELVSPNGGVVPRTRVTGSSQIVGAQDYQDPSVGGIVTQSRPNHLLRPSDMFDVRMAQASSEKLAFGSEHHPGFGGMSPHHGNIDAVIPTQTMGAQGGQPRLVDRSMASPSRYLYKTLKGMQQAVSEIGMDDGYGMEDMEARYSAAGTHVVSEQMYSRQFFSRLKDETGLFQNGFVTLAELNRVFPETDSVTDCLLNDNFSTHRRMSDASDGEHWRGNNNITVASTVIAQTFPAILMDNFIRTVVVVAENGYGQSEYNINIQPEATSLIVNTGDPMFEQRCISEVIRRTAVDVLDSITKRNNLPFYLTISSDIGGETILELTLDGKYTRHVVPTFCDSLFTTQATLSSEHQTRLATDLTFLADEVIPMHNGLATGEGYFQPEPQIATSPNGPLTPQPHPQQGGQPYDGQNHYPGLL